jgi:hypothetical protein
MNCLISLTKAINDVKRHETIAEFGTIPAHEAAAAVLELAARSQSQAKRAIKQLLSSPTSDTIQRVCM